MEENRCGGCAKFEQDETTCDGRWGCCSEYPEAIYHLDHACEKFQPKEAEEEDGTQMHGE